MKKKVGKIDDVTRKEFESTKNPIFIESTPTKNSIFYDEFVKSDISMKRKHQLEITFDFDWKFFAILPAFNLNFHSSTFEIEWLFFSIYTDIITK